jgi:hypothetical protein
MVHIITMSMYTFMYTGVNNCGIKGDNTVLSVRSEALLARFKESFSLF